MASGRKASPSPLGAPKEGAIAWLLGWSMPSAAQNVDQAYAWLDFLQIPEASAKLTEGSGHNPIVTGADALLSAEATTLFRQTYPDDALARLWWQPPESPWYRAAWNKFAEKFQSA